MTTQTDNEAVLSKFPSKPEYEWSESRNTGHYHYEKATENTEEKKASSTNKDANIFFNQIIFKSLMYLHLQNKFIKFS